MKFKRVSIGMIAYQEGPIGQLHHWSNLVKTRRLGVPADPGLAGQIGIAIFVTKHYATACGTESRPDVRYAGFIVYGHVVFGGAVDLQLEIRIRHRCLRYRYCCGVFPSFTEKQRDRLW